VPVTFFRHDEIIARLVHLILLLLLLLLLQVFQLLPLHGRPNRPLQPFTRRPEWDHLCSHLYDRPSIKTFAFDGVEAKQFRAVRGRLWKCYVRGGRDHFLYSLDPVPCVRRVRGGDFVGEKWLPPFTRQNNYRENKGIK
jgi:hypothetical protein